MTSSKPMLVLAFFLASTLIAQQAKVTPLMSKDLREFPGKEGLMITVEYPPDSSDPVHRSPQCACVSVRAGGLHRNAGERRERSHADARSEFL